MNREGAPLFDLRKILQILPHRYPFLLVDRILELDLEKGKILGQKNVTFNEPFFQGHFPDIPIMPGVLITEAMAQVGGILIHEKGYKDYLALLLSIKNAKFRRPVVPGDILLLEAEEIHFSARAGRVQGKAFVNDKIVAEAEIGFALIRAQQI